MFMGGVGGLVMFKHIVEYCDGWMFIYGCRGVLDKLFELHAALEVVGWDLLSCELGVFGCLVKLDVIEFYRVVGFFWVVLGFLFVFEDIVLGVLDGYVDVFE